MESSSKEDDIVVATEKICKSAQSMIDFEAKYLQGLRNICASTELTQAEIRESESKLIKLFSRQLVAKSSLRGKITASLNKYPDTQKWLQLVGMPDDVILDMIEKEMKLESLLEMSEDEMEQIAAQFDISDEDSRALLTSLINLKLWTDKQLKGDGGHLGVVDLHWTPQSQCMSVSSSTPYNGSSPKPSVRSGIGSTSSLPPNTYFRTAYPESSESIHSHPPSPLINTTDRRRTGEKTPPSHHTNKFNKVGTPPPKKKMQLTPGFIPLAKSRSHESQLGNKIVEVDLDRIKKKPSALDLGGSYETIPGRRRLSTESSDYSSSSRGPSGHTSPTLSPGGYRHNGYDSLSDDRNTLSLPVPKSPKTPRTMMHDIKHRFHTKMVFGDCDFCHKYVFRGKLCKYCKYKCHKDCAEQVAPACGLNEGMLVEFIESWKNSPSLMHKTLHNGQLESHSPGALVIVTDNNTPKLSHQIKSINSSVPTITAFPGRDSSSTSTTSSCSSSTSTPSSPINHNSLSLTNSLAPHKFLYPEVYTDSMNMNGNIEFRQQDQLDVINTNSSNDSDRTMIDSNSSERTLPDRADSVDSQYDDDFPMYRQPSLSVALKEWDIPYNDLHFGERIGEGRFGTVYKGNWHGEVAVKVLNTDTDTDNQAQLAAFKLEVAMLRRTRHDNLVLFMGACMKPPKLAIVTSLCKGSTLFTHIHTRKEKLNMNRIVIIASQISHGMGYLHDKKITHRDLMSKNVFLENGKVVITDFGLFNVTKLCHGNRKGDWLTIPTGWLCYLAPEIIRSLQTGNKNANTDLPFTPQSDVYAFGTVWYELLCGEYPFKQQPPESIIWQVGKGIKQSLNSLQASRDVKDLLMLCWSYKSDSRPSFSNILKFLERLPKKRLNRCPSHPVQLSRSAESIY